MLRRLVLVLVIACCCFGCAPLASLRPAGELAANDRSWEVGAGAVALGPRPHVTETWQGAGQIWGTAALDSSLELALIGAFDEKALAGGLALRWTPVRHGILAAAVEIELGYAWAALSFPLALRLAEPVTLYSAPRLGTQGVQLTPGIPAGISVETAPGWMLRGEAQLSWAEFLAYERRTHLALGLAHQR
jgi:hypothetical protein